MQKISEEIQELKAQGEKYDLNYANQDLLDKPMLASNVRRRCITVAAMPKLNDEDLKKLDEICIRTTTERINNLFDLEWEGWVIDAVKLLESMGVNTLERTTFRHVIRRNEVYKETVVASDNVKLYSIPYTLNPSNEYCRGKMNGRFNSMQKELLLKADGTYKVSSYKEEGTVVIAIKDESVLGVSIECSTHFSPINAKTNDGLTNLKTASCSMSWEGNENVGKVMNAIMDESVPAADQSGVPNGYKVYSSSRVSHLSFILDTARNYEWMFYRIAYALERLALSKSMDATPTTIRQRVIFMKTLEEMHNLNWMNMTDEDNEFMSSIVKNWNLAQGHK